MILNWLKVCVDTDPFDSNTELMNVEIIFLFVLMIPLIAIGNLSSILFDLCP